MRTTVLPLVLAAALGVSAAPSSDSARTPLTMGVAVDLLPPAMSAYTGHMGYSAQVWAGGAHLRLRGVAAGFRMPNGLMGNDRFRDLRMDVVAAIVDWFPGEGLKGWWIGGGGEYWMQAISSKADGKRSRFSSPVATLGTGWIHELGAGFYVEPWAAAHLVLGDGEAASSDATYRPQRVQAELSLKLGWAM